MTRWPLRLTASQLTALKFGARQGGALWTAIGFLMIAVWLAPSDNGHGATIFGPSPAVWTWLWLFPGFIAGGAVARLRTAPARLK